MENENQFKMNLFDNLYLILIDAFRYKSENDASGNARVLLSVLVIINLINIFLLINTLFDLEVVVNKYISLFLIIVAFMMFSIYFAKAEKKILLERKLRIEDKLLQKRNYVKSIIIFLLSFGFLALNAVLKNIWMK
jgi:amino acid permease